MTDKEQKNDLLKNESKNFNENSTQENQREEYYKEYLKLSQECKELKKGYAELTEIVNPYMDDFTGYNKELDGFDLILCVKELLQQLARKTEECEELKERLERTEEDLKYQCVDCMNVKSDRYRKALDKIREACLKDTYTFADGTTVRYDTLDDILEIINTTTGERDEKN